MSGFLLFFGNRSVRGAGHQRRINTPDMPNRYEPPSRELLSPRWGFTSSDLPNSLTDYVFCLLRSTNALIKSLQIPELNSKISCITIINYLQDIHNFRFFQNAFPQDFDRLIRSDGNNGGCLRVFRQNPAVFDEIRWDLKGRQRLLHTQGGRLS